MHGYNWCFGSGQNMVIHGQLLGYIKTNSGIYNQLILDELVQTLLRILMWDCTTQIYPYFGVYHNPHSSRQDLDFTKCPQNGRP